MQPYQQRVIEEHDELVNKMFKLNLFIASEPFRNMPRDEQFWIVRQHDAMVLYAEALDKRILLFR